VALRAPGAHGHRMVVAVGAPRHALGADGLAPGVPVEVPTALVAALAAAGRSSLEGPLDRIHGPGGSVGEVRRRHVYGCRRIYVRRSKLFPRTTARRCGSSRKDTTNRAAEFRSRSGRRLLGQVPTPGR